jgi:hypothetical protein
MLREKGFMRFSDKTFLLLNAGFAHKTDHRNAFSSLQNHVQPVRQVPTGVEDKILRCVRASGCVPIAESGSIVLPGTGLFGMGAAIRRRFTIQHEGVLC